MATPHLEIGPHGFLLLSSGTNKHTNDDKSYFLALVNEESRFKTERYTCADTYTIVLHTGVLKAGGAKGGPNVVLWRQK